jgi:hypothetical protein
MFLLSNTDKIGLKRKQQFKPSPSRNDKPVADDAHICDNLGGKNIAVPLKNIFSIFTLKRLFPE